MKFILALVICSQVQQTCIAPYQWPELYRCMNCGSDLQQHVNGKITYLPVMTSRDDGGVPFVKEWTIE
eukprot:COSAG02_NODE_18193_length_954_cov_1.454971_3_plen_68_part_00